MSLPRSCFFLISLCLLISACATTQRTDLFFGMNIPGGGHVSPEQWKNFTDSVITPHFPDGYTETEALGKWMDTKSKQTIAENTKVVMFIGKKGKARETALQEIIQVYMRNYKQQAVLRVDASPKVKFIYNK